MRIFAATAILAVLVPEASAQDGAYPFSGFFGSTELRNAPPEDALKRCALSFLHQNPDGSFATYVVDLDGFQATNVPTYHPINRGTCEYDAQTTVEACTVTEQSPPLTRETIHYDRIVRNEFDLVEVQMFRDAETAAAGTPGHGSLHFYRCPFNEATVILGLSDEMTPLQQHETQRLQFPNATILNMPLVEALAEAVRP